MKHETWCNIFKNSTGAIGPHYSCNCGFENKLNHMQAAAPEMYEQLVDVTNWMEDLLSLGISNGDLYCRIHYVLKRARG